MITFNFLLEWSGAMLGIVGAGLLALNNQIARFGWIFFLLANVLFIVWATRIGATGLLAQQVCFLFTSLLGIYRSGLIPSISCRRNQT